MKQNARRERRIEARDQAVATILGHPDVTVSCRIRNISRSGMCITVDEPVPFGRIVKVEWSDHFLVGRIQRVAPAGTEFRIGLELLYCSKWNDLMTTVLAAV